MRAVWQIEGVQYYGTRQKGVQCVCDDVTPASKVHGRNVLSDMQYCLFDKNLDVESYNNDAL